MNLRNCMIPWPGLSSEQLQKKKHIWLRELSQRRGVWCWNHFKSESMALWKLYGDRGVAIVSSIDRVKDCFLTFAFDASYGEVAYVPWDDRENFDPLESLDF